MESLEGCDRGMWTYLVQLHHHEALIVYGITLEHDTCTLECNNSLLLTCMSLLQIGCKGTLYWVHVVLLASLASHIYEERRESSFVSLSNSFLSTTLLRGSCQCLIMNLLSHPLQLGYNDDSEQFVLNLSQSFIEMSLFFHNDDQWQSAYRGSQSSKAVSLACPCHF